MAFLRSILWVPTVFGVIMGGLAIARLVADGIGPEFVAIPSTIMSAYSAFVGALEIYLLEIPFGIEIPRWISNVLVLWVVFGSSNVRSSIVRLKHFEDQKLERYLIYLGNIIGGPITSLHVFGSEVLEVIRTGQWFLTPKNRFPHPVLSRKEQVNSQIGRLCDSLIHIVLYIGNPLIAAGLLWWNAAEIERLTAGIS